MSKLHREATLRDEEGGTMTNGWENSWFAYPDARLQLLLAAESQKRDAASQNHRLSTPPTNSGPTRAQSG